MQWWGWAIIALVVLVAVAGAVLAVQARRRKGGVIVGGPQPSTDGAGPAGTEGSGTP